MIFSWIRLRIGGQAAFDAAGWVIAVFVASLLRYEFDVREIEPIPLGFLGASMALMGFVLGKAISLYRSRHRVGSFGELSSLISVTAAVGGPFAVANFLFGMSWGIPRSVVAIALPLFLLISGTARAIRRQRLGKKKLPHRGQPVLIYGAGTMAEKLIPQLLEDPQSSFLPLGMIDDDPQLANRWISGVKTFGVFSDLAEIVRRTGATGLVVAIPRASATLLKQIRDSTASLGLKVYILPSFSEILRSSGESVVLRDMGLEDLVGRRSVTVDSPKIDALLRDKTVLITGAGGSIGLELCKQVSRHNPKNLVMLDRDETGLQQAQLATEGSGLLESSNLVLADIRESEPLETIWTKHKPDVVFHAAALKHLPMLEKFPDEAWKTNVDGTLNVLKASLIAGVTTFVNVSTDKAADPSSFLGRSKLLAEQLTSWAYEQGNGNFLSVRFGNVLGSRGSLVPTLAYLIDHDLPVTLTDPDATRYFMSIPEACQLVMQAGVESAKGKIFVLDMGEPVKIYDLARRMIELSGKDSEIKYSGLRRGEKLHESLHSLDAELLAGQHPLIWALQSSTVKPGALPQIRESWLTP